MTGSSRSIARVLGIWALSPTVTACDVFGEGYCTELIDFLGWRDSREVFGNEEWVSRADLINFLHCMDPWQAFEDEQ